MQPIHRLAPGTYYGRIVDAVLSLDKASGDEFMTACFATLSEQGTVMIHNTWQLAEPFKVNQRLSGVSDMYMSDAYLLKRSSRNRHHKRKPQPNHGPVGRNQW